MKKKANKKFENRVTNFYYDDSETLGDIFNDFVKQGFDPADFFKVTFEISYDNVYYEGESPDILFTFEEKTEKDLKS